MTDIPVELDLIRSLILLPGVKNAYYSWLHNHLCVNVVLDPWSWDSMEMPSEVIDTFAREHVHQFSVATQYSSAETEAT